MRDTMTDDQDDIPDNVDLKWIARVIVEIRGEFRGLRESVGSGEQSPLSLDNLVLDSASLNRLLSP